MYTWKMEHTGSKATHVGRTSESRSRSLDDDESQFLKFLVKAKRNEEESLFTWLRPGSNTRNREVEGG